ncbi:MAG: L-histidine N(alpha)-methyltransferase [Myxococcota bacterium]
MQNPLTGKAGTAPLSKGEPLGSDRTAFLHDVLDGLGGQRKELPCKYLYDDRGSRLFDAICDLQEYYPTRTELAIMARHARDMAEYVGPAARIVEYGSGSSRKTYLLLDVLEQPAAYIPLDISGEHLMRSADKLAQAYPSLDVLPVCADYTKHVELPPCPKPAHRTVVYFPGSTIGNFHPHEAQAFLGRIRNLVGRDGALLIGVDLQKDPVVLQRAYDDARGVTAAFNLNLLVRINGELDGSFVLDRFRHRARYDTAHHRVEMHIESSQDQIVRVGRHRFSFRGGETILTEHSYKYTLSGFAALAREAGFAVERVWMDRDSLFSVQLLSAH